MIHHYRDLYLEGTEVKGKKIVPIEGYFQSHTDKAYIPVEHVAIFDEAQRAWTKEELQQIVRENQFGDMPLFIDVNVRQGIRSDMPKLNIDHKAQKEALMKNLIK